MSSSGDGIIARAFVVAMGGDCETLSDVAKKLKAEGFSSGLIERHFDGLTIRTQITNLCRDARTQAVPVDAVQRRS